MAIIRVPCFQSQGKFFFFFLHPAWFIPISHHSARALLSTAYVLTACGPDSVLPLGICHYIFRQHHYLQ